MEAERQVGVARIDATLAFGEYDGAAYGGKPVATGEATYASKPELGIFTRTRSRRASSSLPTRSSASGRSGSPASPSFQDAYQRLGFGATAQYHKLEFQGEQWYGHDGDADGVGGQITSSGGYARLRYFPIPHAYLALRYDTSANPYIVRDFVEYGAFQLYDMRFLIQNVHAIGTGRNALGGALTIGFPPSLNVSGSPK